MIIANKTNTLRFEFHEKISSTIKHVYDVFSYDDFIGSFYVDNKHLVLNKYFLEKSRATNIHYKLMIGWCVNYFGQPIIKTNNDMLDIKCNAPSIHYLRNIKGDYNEICGIYITII